MLQNIKKIVLPSLSPSYFDNAFELSQGKVISNFSPIWGLFSSPDQPRALPEGLKVQASYLTTIFAEEGPPHQKLKE